MTSAVNSQIHTKMFRYPMQFGYAHYLQKKGFLPAAPRILSFGCSTGEELLSLRHYFPTAKLFGCDVVEDALAQARALTSGDPGIEVFHSTLEAIRARGPYDLVMANSVICVNTNNAKRLNETLPFERFEELLCDVASSLAADGVICVHNASYLPDESPRFLDIAKPVRSHFSMLGYVPKFSRAGQLLVDWRVIDGKSFYEVAEGADPALLRLIPNTFYTRSRALQDYRLDYSAFPNARPLNIPQPDDPRLVAEDVVCHTSDAFRGRVAWPRHDNLADLGENFLPEILVRIPTATTGFVTQS